MELETTGGGGTVVFVAGEGVGSGDAELGGILMRAAVKTLPKLEPPPEALLFMNAGVKLCCEGSPLLDDLRALEERGTALLCCGTCLDYFRLKDVLRVGRVSNMIEILGRMSTAARVIRL